MPSEIVNLDEEKILKLRKLAEENLYFFAKAILGFKDLVPDIHLPLCLQLQKMTKGSRKRVLLPRGWFKTTICSIAFPIWLALRNPNIMILLVQNTMTNAESKLRAIRGVFESNELFKALWPELLPTKDCTWVKNSLCINRPAKQLTSSTFECAGVGTQLTSRHYNLIIEDDTVAPELNELGEENLAPTKESIGQAIGFHKLMEPLLVNPQEDMMLVVGTRWFEKDLLSHIEEKEPWFESYVRSCREDENGKSDPNGRITFPERFGEEQLKRLELSLGPYMFSCLYLNNPLSSTDLIFDIKWFQHYEEEPYGLEVYIEVDPAGDASKQKGKDSDFNVVMTSAKHPKTGRIYVLDYWVKRANPGQVLDELFRQVRAWKPLKVGFEAVAYQNTFEYWCRERMAKENFYFNIEPLTHGRRSKEERIRGLQPLFAARMVFFRSWMTTLENELKVFPLGAHDDLADALAMGLYLWGTISITGQRVEGREEDNPLSYERAVEEIMATKRKETDDNPVLDILEQWNTYLEN